MEYIRSQFIAPLGAMNHEIFFKNLSYKQQASSNRQQAGGWAHRRQAFFCQDKNKFDIMGFYGRFSYDSAGPTMSQQKCLLHTRRARHWSFRRRTNFTRGTRSWAEGTSMLCLEPSIFTKLEEIRARKTESLEPGVSKLWRLRLYWVALVSLVQSFIPGSKIRKATSNRLQASSDKRQATSFPSFGYRRVGGPIGYKLFNRGPWIKFYGSWSEGLD